MLLGPAFGKGGCFTMWGWEASREYPPAQFLLQFCETTRKAFFFFLTILPKNVHNWRVVGVMLGSWRLQLF